MSIKTGWKASLREPNAIGWVAFIVLVALIGAAALLFDGGDPGYKLEKTASGRSLSK